MGDRLLLVAGIRHAKLGPCWVVFGNGEHVFVKH